MKPTIALFLHDPKCSVQCGNGMMQALGQHYNFKIFSKSEVEDVFFDDVDIVAFPGGIGDSETWHTLLKANQQKVLDFVGRGGYYLGICMGAYWAGSHYFNILDDVDAVQYITRPNTDTRRPHAKGLEVIWNGHPERMFFYDGCALVGNQEKFKTIATYKNGDPMAIIQNRIGIIGCHPESEKFWYEGYSWMAPHWHNREHHKLLLEFTNQLMQS
jgi:glutamine amidotransferase-like uncharacterized protein